MAYVCDTCETVYPEYQDCLPCEEADIRAAFARYAEQASESVTVTLERDIAPPVVRRDANGNASQGSRTPRRFALG